MTFREAVQAILEANGKTSADLARAMGKSPQALNGIFKKNAPKRSTFDAVVAGLIKLDIKPDPLRYKDKAIEYSDTPVDTDQETTQMPVPDSLYSELISMIRNAPDPAAAIVEVLAAATREVSKQKVGSHQQRKAGQKVA